jgi:hypothetical protein
MLYSLFSIYLFIPYFTYLSVCFGVVYLFCYLYIYKMLL